MADIQKAIQALQETKPPATDRFTYLTLIDEYLSPEILPTLNEVLQDADLTQDIGWDLVEKLVALEASGSAECLETIARLGNPREVILKVLETLEVLAEQYEDDVASPAQIKQFITLIGMLAILHKRIKTRYPSRFLGTTVRTVLETYRANQEMTASVINLVHSLSGGRRPPLPTRKSSVNVANPDKDGDTSKNAPDPEAEQEDPVEGEIQRKLLLSLITCILESYVNYNSLQWSARLLEHLNPGKVIPGKQTIRERYKEDPELLARDNIVGQLVALVKDLGLTGCSGSFVQEICKGPMHRDPLADADDINGPDDVPLSTGGSICLLAYWLFSSTCFDANQPKPNMRIFPDHHAMLEGFLEDDAQEQIVRTPGTIEAVLAIGLWLEHNNLVTASEKDADYLGYHHLLTLCAVFHPSLETRNAAVLLAGKTLHADPDDQDRLKILEDLLENCMYSALKACAVTWLREEIITAQQNGISNAFARPDSIEQLQYTLFPNLDYVADMDTDTFLEYWAQNSPFIIQAANFAYFLLFSDSSSAVVPQGMGPAVKERWVEPLLQAASSLEAAAGKGDDVGAGVREDVAFTVSVLKFNLERLRSS